MALLPTVVEDGGVSVSVWRRKSAVRRGVIASGLKLPDEAGVSKLRDGYP
jgi:hypothetical protein